MFEYRNFTNTPMSVAICYDSSFPRLLRKFRTHGVTWFAIVTNDAWFGNTSGPYHHAEWAKMRAIENRVPIARSANTGISMVVDPWGRVKEKISLHSRGVIVENIMIGMQPSFYAQTGDIFIILISIVGVTGIFWGILDK